MLILFLSIVLFSKGWIIRKVIEGIGNLLDVCGFLIKLIMFNFFMVRFIDDENMLFIFWCKKIV